jgi:pimeloyl-ACP methyl ester carboxylesterase
VFKQVARTGAAGVVMLAAAVASSAEPAAKELVVNSVYGELHLPLPGVQRQPYPLRVADRLEFGLEDRYGGWLILPTQAPAAGMRPWVWYAPQIMGDPWLYTKLLDAGFAIGGTYPGELHGNPECRRVMTLFYETVTKAFGLDPKACLLPQSRGGLMLYNWAAEHPDAVRCSVGIYPVCDIRYWPVDFKETSRVYGLSVEEMTAQLPRHNPVERLKPLAERKVPILHITGSQDGAVPAEKHSLPMQQRYRELGGEMEVESVPGRGHQECPEIFHSQRAVDFFLKHGLKRVGE